MCDPFYSHGSQRNGEAFADFLRVSATNDGGAFGLGIDWRSFDLIEDGAKERVFNVAATPNARGYRRYVSADPSEKVM
jgi:hypothetical protein